MISDLTQLEIFRIKKSLEKGHSRLGKSQTFITQFDDTLLEYPLYHFNKKLILFKHFL